VQKDNPGKDDELEFLPLEKHRGHNCSRGDPYFFFLECFWYLACPLLVTEKRLCASSEKLISIAI
jgi:hypothetical protein